MYNVAYIPLLNIKHLLLETGVYKNAWRFSFYCIYQSYSPDADVYSAAYIPLLKISPCFFSA
jgi:hypothetical protein